MTEQLTLPYLEIKETVGRDYLRKNFTVSSKVAYKIPFEQLQIRDGFNKRMEYDKMEELCDSIKSKGLLEPLTVDILSDGTCYIEKGHRRFKALQMLVERGEVIDFVECYPNKTNVTELDRLADQYVSNNFQSPLKVLEQAQVAYELKNNFGYIKTNESIAELMNISRQKVDMLIKIAAAPDDIRNQIFMAGMGITEAINLINGQKKIKKDANKVEENSHKNTASPTPLPYDPNAEELAELKLLEEKENTGNEDDLPFEETDEEEKVRISTYNPDNAPGNGKDLKLVGNTVANTKEEKQESDGNKKYDESRLEIKQQNNCISLNDRIAVRVEKLDISEGDKKDILDWLKWQMNDLLLNRDWIHANKKENKKAR